MESASGRCILLPAATALLHAQLDQEEFIESQATARQSETLFVFWIVDLHDGIGQGHERACTQNSTRQMLWYHSGVVIYGPFGEAAQSLLMQSFGERIDRDHTPGIQKIALLWEFVATHIELDLIAEALLHTCHHQRGTFFKLFL